MFLEESIVLYIKFYSPNYCKLSIAPCQKQHKMSHYRKVKTNQFACELVYMPKLGIWLMVTGPCHGPWVVCIKTMAVAVVHNF